MKDLRVENDNTMYVLVANVGTARAAELFPVRASIEIEGLSRDLIPSYAEPLDAGAEAWVKLKSEWPLTKGASAAAGADLLPEAKPEGGFHWYTFGNFGNLNATPIPGAKSPCEKVKGCIVELDEANNNYAVAGVPRGTPDRLDAPSTTPERLPERG